MEIVDYRGKLVFKLFFSFFKIELSYILVVYIIVVNVWCFINNLIVFYFKVGFKFEENIYLDFKGELIIEL